MNWWNASCKENMGWMMMMMMKHNYTLLPWQIYLSIFLALTFFLFRISHVSRHYRGRGWVHALLMECITHKAETQMNWWNASCKEDMGWMMMMKHNYVPYCSAKHISLSFSLLLFFSLEYLTYHDTTGGGGGCMALLMELHKWQSPKWIDEMLLARKIWAGLMIMMKHIVLPRHISIFLFTISHVSRHNRGGGGCNTNRFVVEMDPPA